MKSIFAAALLSVTAMAAFAQASAPADDAASAPKHKIAKKLKAYKAKHPASAASNPEASPDKKGGQ
jgi:hypothetical protein